MALWGNNSALALTGTVSTTNTLATVTGSSTLFLSEVKVGDVIKVNSTFAKVMAIASNTSLTISPAWSIANTSGVSATVKQSPKWLAAGSDKTVQSINLIFGVDKNEATAATPPEIPGWVYTNTYTDMHGNSRRKAEALVAMHTISTATDDEDVVYPDYRIVIGTQPASKSVATGTANTFSISVTTIPTGGTVNYRWQQAANANVAFSDLTNAGTFSNTSNATLSIANVTTAGNGSIYRVQMNVTGATASNTVSSNAVLTVV